MVNRINLDDVVKKQGTLEQQYIALQGNVWLRSAEIQELRVNNPDNKELRTSCFRAGDGSVYARDREWMLYITPAELNPILKPDNFSEAVSQIRKTGNCPVRIVDLWAIANDSNKTDSVVVAIDLAKLRLEKFDDEWDYIEFNTENYRSQLNKEELKLVETYHGEGKKLDKTMNMLSNAKIETTRVYVLKKEYLEKNAENKAIARLSTLNCFNFNSDVDASNKYISGNGTFAFAVQSRPPKAVAPKTAAPEMSTETAIAYLKKHRKEITLPSAKELLGIANSFYQKN